MGRGGSRSRLPRSFLLVGVAVLVLLLSALLPDLFRGGGAPAPSPCVRAAEGGPPPPDTRVTALGSGPDARTVAGSAGEFSFPAPTGAVGTYVAEWGPLRAEAPAGPDVEIRLPGKFSVAGRVIDSATREPVVNAEVRCGPLSARPDEGGRFRLVDVPAPDGRPPSVTVTAEGYEPLTVPASSEDRWDDLWIRLRRP